ncbi:MAG: sulfotransferase [Thermoanaerobaculia bacterium]|nr:sulfotransferase [Thermoanaerobaculia bacterium]
MTEEIRQRIFVVGVPRSGTTLVQSLLAAHGEVASWTESHFFRRLFRPVPGLPSQALLVSDPDAAVREFLQTNEALWEDDEEISWRHDPLPWWRRLPLVRSLQGDVTARHLLTIFDDLARCQGRTIWVEKTPAHLRYLPFLERVASIGPDLRFIHVVRDGREAVASLHNASKHWQRPYGVDECVRRWNHDIALSLARVGSPRDHFVVYEDLTADPEAGTRRLLAELGLPWQPDVVKRHGEALSHVTAPGETAWKAGGERSIRPSATSREVLTEEQLHRVDETLRHDLYQQLCQRVPT